MYGGPAWDMFQLHDVTLDLLLPWGSPPDFLTSAFSKVSSRPGKPVLKRFSVLSLLRAIRRLPVPYADDLHAVRHTLSEKQKGVILKKALAFLAMSFAVAGNANACQFSWYHYGDDSTRALIAKEIGSHISNEYCARFNAKHQLFIQSTAYTLTNMGIGHAIVGIRPRDTRIHQTETFTMVSYDAAARTSGDAQRLAVRATLLALDNLMSELKTYKVGQ